MDSDRFDRLTRSLSSRRSALGGLLGGGIAALLGLRGAYATHCPAGKKHCRRRCIPKRNCCTHADCRPQVTFRVCRRGHCACPASRPKFCGGRCVPAAGCCTSADCPAGATCSRRGACVCPAGSSPCGARCALPEGAACTGRPLDDCCSRSCDTLVGGGTCSSCNGFFCNADNPCCPGTPCLQNRCGGCVDRATVCTPGGQPCCDSDCSGGVCLSAAGGRCKHDANCRTCYLNTSQCTGACVGGVCQR
jgi:hypothetical protein